MRHFYTFMPLVLLLFAPIRHGAEENRCQITCGTILQGIPVCQSQNLQKATCQCHCATPNHCDANKKCQVICTGNSTGDIALVQETINGNLAYRGSAYCVSNQSSMASGQSSAEFTTTTEHFISASDGKFENIPLSQPSFKSKVAKFRNGKIRMKRKGTFTISLIPHLASPTASYFNEAAELNYRLTINGIPVPTSHSQTVWASTPNGQHRHELLLHIRFTVFLKEKDELALEIAGSVQAGLTCPQGGKSALISIEEVSSKKG